MATIKTRGRCWVHGYETTPTALTLQRTNEVLTRFGNMMDSVGGTFLTRTADTGQYVPGAYTTASLNLGYFIYKWTAHGVDIYIKFHFQRGGSSNLYPALTITMGAGTNGSGTITGVNREFSRVIPLPRDSDAFSSGNPQSYENVDIEHYASVGENHIFFLFGSSPDLPAIFYNWGYMFSITRPMLVDLSGYDPGYLVLRSFIKNGFLSSSHTNHFMTVINTSDYSLDFSDSLLTPNNYDSTYYKAKEYYALPYNVEYARGGGIFSVASYVRTSTGHRLDPSVIICPITARLGNEDVVSYNGQRYLRTMMFGNASANSYASTQVGNTGSCLAFLWE